MGQFFFSPTSVSKAPKTQAINQRKSGKSRSYSALSLLADTLRLLTKSATQTAVFEPTIL